MKKACSILALAFVFFGSSPALAEIYYFDAAGNRVTAEEFHRMVNGNVAESTGQEEVPDQLAEPSPEVWKASSNIVLINPVSDMVEAQGEEQRYFRYSATFKGEKGGTLVFHPDSCVVVSLDGEPFDTCYLRVNYASPDARTSLEGDKIDRELLIRKDAENPSSVETWKTIRLVGDYSSLTCTFEENGFVSMDFLWPVSDSFRVGSITLMGSVVRRSPVVIQKEKAKATARVSEDELPPFTSKLTGPNTVKFSNPNGFSVNISIRDGDKGVDFTVFPQDSLLVSLPDGNFDVYFVYSHQPRSLYRGETFYLQRGKATFTILRTADGQYALTSDGE